MQNLAHRKARAAWLVSIVVVAAGCGQSERRGDVPGVGVEEDWVTAVRQKAAEKVKSGDTAASQNWDGWGDLTGHIVLKGAPPSLSPLATALADPYCGKLSQPPTNEAIVVGSGGELANVAAFLTTRGAPANEMYSADADKIVELDNRNCAFKPHICLLRTTQTLRILNSDNVGHNTKYNSSEQPFNENIAAGGKVDKQLQKEERSPTPYACDIHKWMSGYLVLREGPYMAKTGDDGSFELKQLPAGAPLTIQLWHERAPGLSGTVKNVSGAQGLKVDGRGRLSLTMPKGGKVEFTLEVDASLLGG
jgi:plastocyanin